MRILGIDPGLGTIGLGLVEATSAHDIRSIEWLTITTAPGLPTGDRLKEIHDDLTQYLREAKPEMAVVERLFFAQNVTTAFDVAQARGCILLALAEQAIPFIEPTPLQLKSAITGDGKAPKAQVCDMLVRMLNLTSIPTPDDAADALAMAVYGALQQRTVLAVTS
ncbi:MAG: crossover junction endodeoxyribonuclease RuvC [Candidatus Peribacteraceae bacterium]|jgi:crossover junction endodeoxyribonuclease RuvC